MAEYKVFHCPYGDDFEGGDKCDRCEKYELCMETPNADVVERSEYQKLKDKNTELEIMSDDFLRMNEVLKKENSRLYEKIDKVKANIEILLEQEKQKDGTYTDVGQGIAIALGLLNNEIGE